MEVDGHTDRVTMYIKKAFIFQQADGSDIFYNGDITEIFCLCKKSKLVRWTDVVDDVFLINTVATNNF